MNETLDGSDTVVTSTRPVGVPPDVDVLPMRAPTVADRSMLVMQYALAVVAVVSAILLSRAS